MDKTDNFCPEHNWASKKAKGIVSNGFRTHRQRKRFPERIDSPYHLCIGFLMAMNVIALFPETQWCSSVQFLMSLIGQIKARATFVWLERMKDLGYVAS